MYYVTLKRFKRIGIDGRLNIPYGTPVENRGGILYYGIKKICVARSAAAHEYFARDDDGKGLERGELSHAIIERLNNFKTREERDKFWEKTIWVDETAKKYRKPEHQSYWLWNDDFYNAPIEDLKKIAALVGVEKER